MKKTVSTITLKKQILPIKYVQTPATSVTKLPKITSNTAQPVIKLLSRQPINSPTIDSGNTSANIVSPSLTRNCINPLAIGNTTSERITYSPAIIAVLHSLSVECFSIKKTFLSKIIYAEKKVILLNFSVVL